MSICNTVSLSPPHIFFSSFKWDFKWQIRSLPPPMSKPGDVSTIYVHREERTLLLSTALCASSAAARGELRHGQQPPQLTAHSWCSRSVSGPGWGRERVGKGISFLGPLSVCPTKPVISSLVVGAQWKARDRAFSWRWGVLFWCVLLALVSAHVCMCVRREGWLSWPDLSAP